MTQAPSPACFMISCKNEPFTEIQTEKAAASVEPFEKEEPKVDKENMSEEMKKKMAYYKLVYKKKK